MRIALLLVLTLFTACAPPVLEDVHQEVFAVSCAFTSCHGTQGSGDLELADLDGVRDELIDVPSSEVPGEVRVIPGDSEGSLLFKLLNGPVGDADQMPPSNGTATVSVTDDQLELVRDWIDGGAE
jgi:hypothetical protein